MTIANFPRPDLYPSPTLYPGTDYNVHIDTVLSKIRHSANEFDLSILSSQSKLFENDLLVNKQPRKQSKLNIILSDIKKDKKEKVDLLLSKQISFQNNNDLILSLIALNNFILDTNVSSLHSVCCLYDNLLHLINITKKYNLDLDISKLQSIVNKLNAIISYSSRNNYDEDMISSSEEAMNSLFDLSLESLQKLLKSFKADIAIVSENIQNNYLRDIATSLLNQFANYLSDVSIKRDIRESSKFSIALLSEIFKYYQVTTIISSVIMLQHTSEMITSEIDFRNYLHDIFLTKGVTDINSYLFDISIQHTNINLSLIDSIIAFIDKKNYSADNILSLVETLDYLLELHLSRYITPEYRDDIVIIRDNLFKNYRYDIYISPLNLSDYSMALANSMEQSKDYLMNLAVLPQYIEQLMYDLFIYKAWLSKSKIMSTSSNNKSTLSTNRHDSSVLKVNYDKELEGVEKWQL